MEKQKMKIDLNAPGMEQVKEYERIREMNSDVIRMYAFYLMNRSRFITKELVQQIVRECDVSEEYAFFVLLTAVCGLNPEEKERDKEIEEAYFLPSIRKLDASTYRNNLYYKTISIPSKKLGNWEFCRESYQPYEGFIYNDIVVQDDFREIPRLGFFAEEFTFPAVLENGVEWMTVTPNEIETMQPVVECVSGKVVTFGLGIGYFTFMVSEKENVDGITVVEKDENVIHLFETYILPQFPNKEKVRIVTMDAFEYAENLMTKEQYDYAFADLWHNASDGLPLYLKMANMEERYPETKFFYWIEESLLSAFRWQAYEEIKER